MTSATNESNTSTIYGADGVFVEQLLPAARARLATVAQDAPLIEAARLLRPGTDLVVVCAPTGTAAGVITKTDVVAHISECGGAACEAAASMMMSSDILQCTPDELVKNVWSKMKSRGFKNALVADAEGRPLGVLNARDALGAILQDVEDEESLLRDYVMGVGYH